MKDEGNETVTKCNALKMTAADGKKRLTDVATTEQLLRIIQSIPSPKAEPFKLWLAEVGRERIEETIDPELIIDRALETYLKKAIPASGLTSGCRQSRYVRNSPMSGRTEAYKKVLNLRYLLTRLLVHGQV